MKRALLALAAAGAGRGRRRGRLPGGGPAELQRAAHPRRQRPARRPDLQRHRGLQRRDRPAARLDARLPPPRPDLPAPRRPRGPRRGGARLPHRRPARPHRDPAARSARRRPVPVAAVRARRLRPTSASSGSTIDRPASSYKLALARYRDGDIDGAIAALKDTLRLDERLADAHYLLGVCLREQERLPDALPALENSALALSPGLVPAREELADLYGALDRHNEELDQLQMIAGLDRDHVAPAGGDRPRPGARRTLGSRGADAGQRARAQPERAGDLPRARQGLAGTAARRSRASLSKAREALERVASSPAATSEMLTLYGRALLQEGDVDGAEHALQQATAALPRRSAGVRALRERPRRNRITSSRRDRR